MSGSGEHVNVIVSESLALPESLPTVDELIRAKLVENVRESKQVRELPNIVTLVLLGVIIGIASNVISAIVAYIQDYGDTKSAEQQLQEMRDNIDKNDYYKERWGSLKHRPVAPDELQTLDCVFNYKDLLVRTRNLIIIDRKNAIRNRDQPPKTLPDLISQITSGKICLHQLDKECKAAVMGTYSEADRMRYLEGDSKAFSFFKVDTMEEQGKSKQQYRLKSRKSHGADTLFTQSETFSNLGTMSDVFTESEMEQSRSSSKQQNLPGDICRIPEHESTDTIINNKHTT